MDKIIIGLVGELAAGKGTIAAYLEKNYHAISFGFSGALRETLNLYDLEITRENMQKLSTILRENFGEDALAKAMAKKVKESNSQMIIVDGVRRFTDIENLTPLPNFHLLYVTADRKTRYERLVKRSQNIGDNTMSYETFCEKEQAEADRQIPEVGLKAQHKLDNNGTVEQLYQQLETILTTLHASKN